MKYGRVETERLYFSSSEVAEQVGVPVEVLHSWEKDFSELKPQKNKAGKRIYRSSDIEVAKKIKNTTAENIQPQTQNLQPRSKPRKKTLAENFPSQHKLLLEIRNNLQNVLKKLKIKN